MKKKQKVKSWFYRIPRKFFQFPLIINSFYIGFGFIQCGLLHFQIWKESSQVENIFSSFNSDLLALTPQVALLMYIILGLLSTILFHLLFRRIRSEAGIIELIFWGTILSLILSWLPWLFASSITSTIFLFLYCMISISGIGLSIRVYKQENENRKDAWKMFVNIIKACAAIIALLLGAIATNVLGPWRDTGVEKFELLRYALLSAYLVIGMLGFLLIPLLFRSIDSEPIDDVDLEFPGPV